jgi:hypothetical protein
MSGISGVARGRALSAGTMLVFGGGLALYQMTSLVLGPAGSRQLHLSLAIPAVEVQDLSEPLTSSINVVLGTRVVPPATVSGVNRVSASHRAPAQSAASRPKAPATAPVPVAPAPVAPALPPTTQPSSHPLPPVVTDPESQPDASNRHVGD